MANKQSTSGQGPTSVEGEGLNENEKDLGSDQGGGQPGKGQSGGGQSGNSPKAKIAGKDGPQTGGSERGNPGVGG